MYFAAAQILFGVWAAWFAHFQVPINEAFIGCVPKVNPWSKPFHNRGAASSCIVAAIIGLSFFALTRDWIGCIYLAVLFYCIYKILFDGVLGEKIHEDFFYLGDTAKQDSWLNKHFPHGDAGEVKVITCGAIIIILNLVNYLL